jgi:hypothetical protein
VDEVPTLDDPLLLRCGWVGGAGAKLPDVVRIHTRRKIEILFHLIVESNHQIIRESEWRITNKLDI